MGVNVVGYVKIPHPDNAILWCRTFPVGRLAFGDHEREEWKTLYLMVTLASIAREIGQHDQYKSEARDIKNTARKAHQGIYKGGGQMWTRDKEQN